MERMLNEEDAIWETIDTFTDRQYDSLKEVNKFISERSLDVSSRAASGKDLSHPNKAFYVIKDFSKSYAAALGDNLELFSSYKGGLLLADPNDHKAAMDSLVRLKRTYNLSITDMVKGDYLGFQGPPLSAFDVYQIGDNAILDNEVNESLEWLNVSLQMYSRVNLTEMDEKDKHPSVGSLTALIGFVHLVKGNVSMAKSLYTESHTLDPTDTIVTDLGDLIEKLNETIEDLSHDNDIHLFGQLCRHELIPNITFTNTPQIVCRYRKTLIPYYQFKEELLSIQPFVSVIYDFVSDRESEHFISMSLKKLHRGRVSNDDKQFVVSTSRTGQIGWLDDEESDVVKDISLRIHHVTGLDTAMTYSYQIAESFQVVNYGIGGHYSFHKDAADISVDNYLDRLATFLFYLNDVDKGGSTVFKDVQLSVAPRKNMALFWYNYNTSNRLDEYTNHAGCPVLHGQKWIANKWIRAKGNAFTRRCGLKPDVTQLDIEEDMRRGYK
ncbi:hypothetical protein Btru_033490 [Bulinus truncatus]|nr:hypothetical protein Btru_033490 [Bulinus truncatus]